MKQTTVHGAPPCISAVILQPVTVTVRVRWLVFKRQWLISWDHWMSGSHVRQTAGDATFCWQSARGHLTGRTGPQREPISLYRPVLISHRKTLIIRPPHQPGLTPSSPWHFPSWNYHSTKFWKIIIFSQLYYTRTSETCIAVNELQKPHCHQNYVIACKCLSRCKTQHVWTRCTAKTPDTLASASSRPWLFFRISSLNCWNNCSKIVLMTPQHYTTVFLQLIFMSQ